MIKGRLGRIFALGEVPGEGASETGTYVPMPSLDERANIYLRALHGDRDFTSQERLDARHHLLNTMASDIAARSQILPPRAPAADHRVRSEPLPPPEEMSALESNLGREIAALSRERSPNPEYSYGPAAHYDDGLTPPYEAYDKVPIRPRRRGFMEAAKIIGLALVVTIGIFGYHFWTSPVMFKSEVVTADPSTANDFKSEVVTADAKPANDKVEAAFLDHLGREVVTRGVPVYGVVPLPEAYVVQVASQRTEAEARASYRALQARYPSVLGSRRATITRADLGDKGLFYRAEVGPFVTAEEAGEMCKSLKAAGGQCLVQGIYATGLTVDPPRTDTVAPR